MAFTLDGVIFGIESATLAASVPDPYWCDTYNDGEGKELSWQLDVRMEEVEVDDAPWEPSIYHHSLLLPVRRWMEIEGQTITWVTACDPETDEPNGGFYVWEHEDIPRAVLRFLTRNGTGFQLSWEGECNVFWDERFGENVPFRLQTVASFTGVLIHGSERDTAETMRQRLSQFLDPDDFIQGPVERGTHCYQTGVGMVSCVFKPKS